MRRHVADAPVGWIARKSYKWERENLRDQFLARYRLALPLQRLACRQDDLDWDGPGRG